MPFSANFGHHSKSALTAAPKNRLRNAVKIIEVATCSWDNDRPSGNRINYSRGFRVTLFMEIPIGGADE